MTPSKPNYECIHEELLQNHNLKINDLENELNYKKEKLEDLKRDNEKISSQLSDIDEKVNKIVIASITDDDKLKDLLKEQDKRITALETTNSTLKWVIGIGFTALTSTVGLMAFLITNLH